MNPVFLAATATITPEMLKPLSDGLTANIGVVLPFALSIFGTFIGIKLVPRLINYFMY